MKRTLTLILLTIALVFAFGSVAYANFGPHGGYISDTDGCAGCHRAHTSFSTVGWKDKQGFEHESALLVSDASTMTEFCYACHGDLAPGAATNVQSGVFDSGPTTAGGIDAATDGNARTFYTSNSSFDATLNGGGFERLGGSAAPNATVMSTHNMSDIPGLQSVDTAIRWGYMPTLGNSDLSPMSSFRCTDCHDPHGSSNYRILKDGVNGAPGTGGYNAVTNEPEPAVLSNEEGYPGNGFHKGTDGVLDKQNYKPNYTTAQYVIQPTGEGISGWCAGCHSEYDEPLSSYDYGAYEGDFDGAFPLGATGGVNDGGVMRHRHPLTEVADNLDAGSQKLNVLLNLDPGLPLEMPNGQLAEDDGHTSWGTSTYLSPQSWDGRGKLNCLTCHRAHGTEAAMEGWAVADIPETNNASKAPAMLTPGAAGAPPQGVSPNYSEALLRYDNRGVCERCHNK